MTDDRGTEMKCDELYDRVVSGSDGGNYVLFELAQCFLSGYDRSKLYPLLRSDDFGLVSDGLFILGEIGPLAKEFIDDISKLAQSEDAEIRKQAGSLLAVYGKR